MLGVRKATAKANTHKEILIFAKSYFPRIEKNRYFVNSLPYEILKTAYLAYDVDTDQKVPVRVMSHLTKKLQNSSANQLV